MTPEHSVQSVTMPFSRPETIVAFSAGGAACAVGAGFVTAAERRGWRPDRLVGTSGGAATAIGWAKFAGEPERVEEYWRSLEGNRITEARRRIAKTFGPDERLEDLAIPVSVVVAELGRGKLVVDSGPVRDVLLAATAFPVLHKAVALEDGQGERHLCVDGGLVDYWGLLTAQELGAEQIISVGHRDAPAVEGESASRRRALDGVLSAAYTHQLRESLNRLPADLPLLTIHPEVPQRTGLGQVHGVEGLIRSGEELAELALESCMNPGGRLAFVRAGITTGPYGPRIDVPELLRPKRAAVDPPSLAGVGEAFEGLGG